MKIRRRWAAIVNPAWLSNSVLTSWLSGVLRRELDERGQLADRFEEVLEAIHAEMAAVRASLHRAKLEEAERDPRSWLQ